MALIQSTPTPNKEVKKISKGRVLVQRLPPKPATKHPDLDLDAYLRALSMSTTHDEEIDQDLRFEDKEEDLPDGEKMRQVETFVITSRKISISHRYSKEKHPKGPKDCMIKTFKMLVKLGLTTKRHIFSENAVIMEREGYEAKEEVMKLKIELTKCRKTIKEFQTISTTLVELKKQVSFHEGWAKMKNIRKEEMETIGKLASHVYKLIEEGVEIRNLKSQMASHLEKLDSYLPTITQLEQSL